MKQRLLLLLSILTILSLNAFAQSTLVEAYNVLQAKCVSCHSNADPQSGLDLEGSGPSATVRAQMVRNNLVNISPANTFADGKNYKYIYPGRPDLSYLFRKINQTFEPTIHFDEGEDTEGGTMPPATEEQLTEVEKEMIRQWILYGAPTGGTVVDPQLIEDYYADSGLESFPDGPPPAPTEGEGFQVKMGPYFLSPAGQGDDELEYFQKYELGNILTEDLEVNRVDIKIGPSSHHFIIYDFDNPSYANNVSPGFRLEPYHNGIGLVAAVQESTDLKLPEGTAFSWEDDLVLELNSHYINYSSTQVLKAEAYANIYVQSSGTAAQEMQTELIVKDNIYINNNGNMDTETQIVNYNLGEVFVWGLMGHTHQWGTGYKVYTRENGQQGELIYDAACVGGNPGCVSPFFDYQHIPLRYMNPFLPITFNFNNGIMHEATYVNNGPGPVQFGLTSDDEMMVLVMMYVNDTTGVVFDQTTSIEDLVDPLDAIKVFPNPVTSEFNMQLPADIGAVNVSIIDMLGRPIYQINDWQSTTLSIPRQDWASGMYLYRVEDRSGNVNTGKVLISD
jgi:hypothetical protein